MTVIPFDPGRRRRPSADEPKRRMEVGAGSDNDLRAHIALLERALVQVLRENAQNWARAEAAELRLAVLERQDMR